MLEKINGKAKRKMIEQKSYNRKVYDGWKILCVPGGEKSVKTREENGKILVFFFLFLLR
jgi:hypothetical protein